jgi:DMSO/TMAO reductase YedYZ heme-binding membrane subunit
MVFVTTNYLGLVSAAMLLVLVLISNNKAIVRFGLERWKRIQRLAYFAVAIAIIHGFMYQLIEKRSITWVLVVATITALTLMLQLSGIARRSSREPSRS